MSWCLENAHEPLFDRARQRLAQLTPADATRTIRLVSRRCQLDLIERAGRNVVVHYWGQQGPGDLRPFFKRQGLARTSTRVTLIDRKRERSTFERGDDFLYGESVNPFWPWRLYEAKWRRRYQEERNDWKAAPCTWSGYGWEGIEPNRIPWAALKSAWRHTMPMLCLNCDTPTILTSFGFPWSGLFNRYARFYYACRRCRRLFLDGSVKNVTAWMLTNLDAAVLPKYDMIWDRPVPWRVPSEA